MLSSRRFLVGLDRCSEAIGPESLGCSTIQLADFSAGQSQSSAPSLAQIKIQEKSLLMTWLVCGDDLRLTLTRWTRSRRNMGLRQCLD